MCGIFLLSTTGVIGVEGELSSSSPSKLCIKLPRNIQKYFVYRIYPRYLADRPKQNDCINDFMIISTKLCGLGFCL